MTDEKFLEAWKRAALAVHEASVYRGNPRSAFPWIAQTVSNRFRYNESRRTFDGALRRTVLEGARARPRGDEPLAYWVANEMKVVRLGFAIAAGDADAIFPSEAAYLDGAGILPNWYAKRTRPAPHATPPDGPTFEVEAGFACGAKPARARSSTAAFRGVARVLVERLSSRECRPLWRLPTPDGGHVDVISHEGTTFRPLLAPGTWTPITEGEFAEASKGDNPWRDNPFLRFSEGAVLSLSETCLDPEPSDDSALALKAAEAAAVARAGRLVSVDGIVHRATTMPRLSVQYVSGARSTPGVRVEWTLDTLRSTDGQGTLCQYRSRDDDNCGLRGAPTRFSFPVESHVLANAVARATASLAHVAFVDEGPVVPLHAQAEIPAVTALCATVSELSEDDLPREAREGSPVPRLVDTARRFATEARRAHASGDVDALVEEILAVDFGLPLTASEEGSFGHVLEPDVFKRVRPAFVAALAETLASALEGKLDDAAKAEENLSFLSF